MKKTLLFFGIIFCFSFKHPFYLSVTDLKYNSHEKALQGSVKIFINDLEDALSKLNHQTVDLINSKDSLKTSQTLQDYVKKRLKIKVNQNNLAYDFLGFEKEQEVIWLYIEYKNCPKPKIIEIENGILYDFIKSQSNIVHVDMDGSKKSSKVNYPEKILTFDF